MPLQFAATGTVVLPDIPTGIANIWEWWEPSREGLSDSAPIGTLTGQVASGATHNFVQTDGNRKPTYVANQINGLGIADFSATGGAGTQDYMVGVNPSALTSVHFFVVVKADADPPASLIVPWKFGTASQADFYPSTDSNIWSAAFSTTRRNVGNPVAALTSWHVVEIVSTSTEYTFKLDGIELFTTVTNTVGITSSCVLGAANTSGTEPWNGEFAGIYIFSAKLSSSERAEMVAYLNSRFNLGIV